ncbi:PRC-barrel domain protein [Albidovulum inexpectatum]|uniref:PRC-barrel domain protein n=1 Tax=Albidovulum inexpectatum TaxID=196587 RepID=A0A2S5JHS7_9RHOB|nr:PRC-barrel domain-containing protein [Albidovulum inexpectatum]PPB80969.1 PRC-barrel domain protein [Albidovulum inexpectatum]
MTIKTLALSAALMCATAPMALADMHGNLFQTEIGDNAMLASEFIGMRVYAAETIDSGVFDVTGPQDTWNDIGEINDVVLTRDGEVLAVIVDVGGFLGIGEKPVALNMKALRFLGDSSTEDPDDFFIVAPAALGVIEEAQTFHWGDDHMDTMKADAGMTATGAAYEREGYTPVMPDDLTTEDLTGERVYDANDEWIGEVSELLLTDDGKLDRAVIDVGGFLGIGEKPVALSMDQIRIVRDENSVVRVYVPLTKEELEALPTYEK